MGAMKHKRLQITRTIQRLLDKLYDDGFVLQHLSNYRYAEGVGENKRDEKALKE